MGWRFSQVADLKINREKLEAAVKSGVVDMKTVAKYTVLKDVNPYVKLSITQEEVDGDA